MQGRGKAGEQRAGAETREPRPGEKRQDRKRPEVNGQLVPPREEVSIGICWRNWLLKNPRSGKERVEDAEQRQPRPATPQPPRPALRVKLMQT